MKEATVTGDLGERKLMLGNEAIARGAIEAGVAFAASYPGTPSTDILETLAEASSQYGIRVEWSINEMVAFEKAMGVSLAGLRAMVSMKHAGMNWITDPLSIAVLGGVRGGVVIVTADDPGCHSSANEQDNRFYGMFFKIPVLEPSDPQESKDLTRRAFEISERIGLPVVLRSVTRVSHARGDVLLGEIDERQRIPSIDLDPERFCLTTARSLKRHHWLNDRQDVVKEVLRAENLDLLEWNGQRTNVITSGVAYTYVKEAVEMLGVEGLVGILKVGGIHPPPVNHITKILEASDLVMVVEEGAPFLELHTRAISSEVKGTPEIVGKMSKDLREGGELTTEAVAQFIANFVGVDAGPRVNQALQKEIAELVPPRSATFCAGCPHSATFYVLSKIRRDLKKKGHSRIFFVGDIGCYSLGIYPPYEIGDAKYSMGSSTAVAQGLSEFVDDKVLAIMGDGTFYHSGIPGLLNGVYNKSDITFLIVDNGVIGMTGNQPHPGSGFTATGEKGGRVPIEKIIRGCGVESLEIVDSFHIKELEGALIRALAYPGVSVVISRNLCALEKRRLLRKEGSVAPRYFVDQELCNECFTCLRRFSCPAIYLRDDRPAIDEGACLGCSACAQICPTGAIQVEGHG